jgi:hypothetical protein
MKREVTKKQRDKAEAFAKQFGISNTQAVRSLDELFAHERGALTDWELYEKTGIYKGEKPVRPATAQQIAEWQKRRAEALEEAENTHGYEKAVAYGAVRKFETYLIEARAPLSSEE